MKKNVLMTILVCATAVAMLMGILYHVTGTIRPARVREAEARTIIRTEDEDVAEENRREMLPPEETTEDETLPPDEITGENSSEKKRSKSKVTEASDTEITTLEIRMNLGDLTIQTGEALDVTYTGDEEYKPDVQTEDGVLSVIQPDNQNWLNLRSLFRKGGIRAKVTITLPEGTKLSSVDIREALGDIAIHGLAIHDGSIGSIANNLGDIILEDCSLADLTVHSDLGDVKVENCRFTYLEVQQELGDVKISTPQDLSNAALDLKTDLGDVSVNGTAQGTKHTHTGSSDIALVVHNDLGDIKVTY